MRNHLRRLARLRERAPAMHSFGVSTLLVVALGFVVSLLAAPLASAQDSSPLNEELRRIFGDGDYETRSFGPAKWLDDGAAYTTLEASPSNVGSKDIVRYETVSGSREILVSSSRLIPKGLSTPLDIADYVWSDDRKKLLIFTKTKRVWRLNTRGDYWVLEIASGKLNKLGGDAPASSLMFAKFSPDATRVAYVRQHDVFVEYLDDGEITVLTEGGSQTNINGTSDWVYEEEFGVRDGFRWSPDGRLIAFWNFDSTGIGNFTLINNTDTLYPEITSLPYPKAGTTNSAVRIGVVGANGGPTRWMQVPGDDRDTYIARMEWAGDSETLVLQHLNRLQNQNDVLLADVASGRVQRVHRDQSDAWVDVVDDVEWLNNATEFSWLSEQSGWRHAYRIARNGGGDRRITDFEGDVISVTGTDLSETWLYFIASPHNPTQRYFYRTRLDGSSQPERLTPTNQPGTHDYALSPNARWAFHTYSRFDMPPRIDLVALPDHRSVRVLEDNADVAEKVAALISTPTEFFTLEIGDGVTLDGWMLQPDDFDASTKYPLLVYVYGEPAGQTVLDRWGGSRILFHRALARAGFVVASFDNRGTPAPKGAAWRKIVYGAIGDLTSKDQAAAVRAFTRKNPFIDTNRVAVWGWSGGGSSTLNCMFRFPEIFKVGVAVAPVPDQKLYDTIYQERYMGLPDENAEAYRLGSPIHFAEGLEGQLLLIHGTGDDNVHYQGTERLVNRLIELDKPFDMMVYPNRTHAIREGKGTSLHVYSSIARYLTNARW